MVNIQEEIIILKTNFLTSYGPGLMKIQPNRACYPLRGSTAQNGQKIMAITECRPLWLRGLNVGFITTRIVSILLPDASPGTKAPPRVPTITSLIGRSAAEARLTKQSQLRKSSSMTSLRQTEANHRNERESTRPTTDAGKRRSRRNAIRHGLTAASGQGVSNRSSSRRSLTILPNGMTNG
jgi:hypothetical protein